MATNEKIQLKGASAYKKDLQQIAAQSKALAAEMKAVKASFDSSTTAEQKNEAVGKQLTKQIELQKQRVDLLTKAYEEEVKASGAQSTAAAKAQEALFKGQATLNKMEAENRELAKAENEETVAAEKNTDAHSKLNSVLSTAGAAIGAVVAATVAAAKALWDATNASGQWADNLLTLSKQTNVSTDTLQKWDYASRFIDTDTETMTKALAKVTSQQRNAIKTGNDYVTLLDGQVISLKDANGEYKTTESVFYEMIDALGQIEDETLQDAAAQELFSKSFQDMKPLIDAGSEGLNKYMQEAEAMGLVLSEDAVGSLGSFDDEMQRFKATTEIATKQLAVGFLPATQRVAQSLTELAQTVTTALADGFQEADADVILDALFDKFQEGLENISAIMPGIAKFVIGLATKIADFVAQNTGLILNTALQIILALVNGLSENLPTLIPAIVQMIMTIVTTLTAPENINMLMDAAVALLMGLANGLIAAVPVLIRNIPQIVMNIVNSLISEATYLYKVGTAWINSLGQSIYSAMTSLDAKIIGWVQGNIIQPVKDMASRLVAAGKDLVTGLWNGINDKMAWIKGKVKSWVGNLLSYFKNLLGIHSPSTVFYDYGENIAQGLANGITNGMGYVRTALGAMPGVNGSYSLDASPAGLGGVTLYIDGIKYNTDDYVDTSITNFVENMVRRSQMYGR